MKKTFLSVLALLCAASAHAGLLYEPSNYAAQDNLVVNLDGIRNAGPLKAHDSSADEWKNIGRVANDAEFFAKDGDTSAWVADGYHFAGGAYGKLKFWQNLGNSMTVQIVADAKGSDNTTKWPSFFGCPEDWANIYYSDKSGEVLHFKADAITGLSWNTGRAALSGWGGRYLNAALNSSEHKQILVQSDSFATGWKEGPGGSQSAPGSKIWTFGSCGNSQGDLDDRYLVGTIKAIRVYNKILSNTELAANRVIDEARFFTGIPVTNVVVETAIPGLEGNEGGVFAIDDDGYTFTAPQKATKDGTVYSCTGYTLETWNGSAWSAPVSYACCSYTATDTSAKVRLTWQWQRAHAAIPTALDPLFNDYVTDGLVLHLDGIRNVGADKPHSWTSPQWIDLVKGNIASFQHDEADASTWLDDGYYFGGRSFAQFVNALSGLTNTVTVQVVCDTTTNALLKLKTSANPNVLWPNLVGTGDNDQLNIYYDMNGATRGRLTFKNANGGNVNLANNADKDAWEGRYATAIRNGNKNYILQTTNIADAVSLTHSFGNISAATLRIGSAGVSLGTRNQRWFLGTIKAVRIYDRVLTDAELAQNRAIDEARFFGGQLPVANVVVASSVRGVEGNEPEGEYALPAGGHTFSAPASVTVGEDTYSCTGYTLETWSGSSWSAPASYGSSSYSATDTTALVRLTWQWTHTAGPGYDAAFSDYVTDGLILHLDGIRNSGPQPAHDSGATQWADLANKGGAMRFTAGADKSRWTGDGFYFDGATYAVMNGTRTLDGPFTAQEVVDFDADASHRKATSWPMFFGATVSGDPFSIYHQQANVTTTYERSKIGGTPISGDLQSFAGEYLNVIYTGTQAALFQTATPASLTAISTSVPGTRTFTLASADGGASDGRYESRMLTGAIKGVRLYSRVLSDSELAQNRAADEVRFFGRAPAATGDLVVCSDVEGLSGDQPNGAYRPAGNYSFTAPAEAVADGVTYICTGYTLETWDGSAWGSAVSYASSSYSADVSSASARLTWNWSVANRITKIPDYDVDDYVQTDLYLHFDGIRNAGATAEHSDSTNIWANLGTGGASLNATFDYASNSSAGDSWEADGYHFKYGGKFATLAGNPSLGNMVTIQVVTKAEASGKPSGSTFPTYFGSTNDYLNVYGFGPVARTFLKVFNNQGESGNNKAGGRQEMSGTWQGEYLTAIWHSGKYQIFQTTTPDPENWFGKWRYNWANFVGRPFYIGGVYKGNDSTYVDERRLTGKIQALRVYKRTLTDEELEQNRKVDEARFKGNPPDCNVVVVNDGGVCDPEPGSYKVDGTWTFTATSAPGENGTLDSVRGYTIDTWNGSSWVRSQGGNGDTYTYSDATGKIRLTWNSQPRAFTLIIR